METYHATDFKLGETIIIRETGKLATVLRIVGNRYLEYQVVETCEQLCCIPAHGDVIKV